MIMGNACLRSVVYSSSSLLIQSPKDKKTTPSPPVRNESVKLPRRNGSIAYNITPVVTSIHGGDDSAIDELLEGRMDLDVVLPDKKEVRMTVERRTPMMDLLVKVATPNKIKPGGHMIQVYDKGNRCLSYNPSTPIGSLDTKTVYIVPKKQHTESKKLKFEQTFRLQIRLPHNQLTAYRFSLKETLGEVKQKVCKEKNLDPSLYHLVHPNHQNKILDANMTFEEYNCKEISLLSAKSIEANSSQVEIISYQSHNQQERKKPGYQQRKGLSSIGISSNDNQKPASHVVKPPLRSRFRKGPAPPPPTLKENKREINSLSKNISKSDQHEIESGSHSRHSSDSSGYHEASVYSEPSNGIITSNKSEHSPKHNLLKEKTSTPKERNIESFLTKPTSPILSLNKKRKAPPPPTAQVAGKKTFELAQEVEAKNDRSSALKEAPESHNSKMDINVSQTDESVASLVHDPFDHQKLCSSKTDSSVSNNENNDKELHPSILRSIPDMDHGSPKSFSPTLEDESPYPDETYSLSDIDKDEMNREDSDKYSISDIDEELVETIVTSVNPLGSPESDYTSKLHVQDSSLERDSDDKVETVSEKESNGIMNSEFKRTENFEDACLETLNINFMDHKINILDYSSDNETSVDEYDEKSNPVDTFRQTPISTYNDDSETSLNNNKTSSMKNTKANVISVDEMTEEVITLHDFTPLEETPIEEDFISEILDPPEEFSNEAVVPTVTECDDDPEHPPPLPSTDPPSRPLSPETYFSSLSRRTLPVPVPRKRPPSRMNLLHGTTSSTTTNKGVLSGSSDLRGRRSSLSSLNTIDDLDQTFQSTIAEAERLLATEDQRGIVSHCIIINLTNTPL
ncbi:uncharacterized protein LOC143246384 isoform X2 [Tachypleus tridentatus]|uniref:uncharacterized protein LOC143246384 isoform X2 n=1 Tax=Tachypleus tridentatus TaxID=6853 RepID=UPI003FD4A7A6